MAKQKTVTYGGKSYNIDQLDDVAALQAVLVPPNFPLEKRDGVRLFMNLQSMLDVEFKKHLAHNFKNLVVVAMDQQADGQGSKVAVSFKFELDFSALNVAAFAKPSMSFNRPFSTKGTPKSHDINQGDFLSPDGLEVALDTSILDSEMAPPPDAEPPEGEQTELPTSEKPKKAKKEKAGEVVKFEEGKTAKPKKAGKKTDKPAE